MKDKYFYEVMFDDTSIDVSKEVGLPTLSVVPIPRTNIRMLLSPWSSFVDLSALWRLPKMQL